MRVQCVQDGGSIQLHVEEHAGAGPLCLLVHGLADGGFIWRTLIDALAPDFRCIAVDLRGHGGSDWSMERRYDLEDYAGDVGQVLEALGARNPILIGHSLGAAAIAKLVSEGRHSPGGLVLVDMSLREDPTSAAYLHAQIMDSYRTYRSVDEYQTWLEERRPLTAPEVIAEIARGTLFRTKTGWLPRFDPAAIDRLLAPTQSASWKSQCAKIDTPTLVVRGGGSAVLSQAEGLGLVQMMPSARLAVVQRAGHAVPTDNPRGLSEVVVPFVRDVRARLV